ncbi:MAG: 3'-5' exonuclease domain-containing protein 2 [Bacteroidales bacterium]|nr:3'-5' exonuclease domain-containing protein 2 [Bacteroidales bacterium]
MTSSKTIPNSISKEELADLPAKEFAGYPVTVINLEQAEIAVKQIRESGQIVGFDTETRPSFQKGVSYRVCLVQLSVGQVCYLFRLNKIKEFPACLKELLEDGNLVKVGLSTQDDFKNLRKWNEDLEPKGFIELQNLVKTYGITDLSLAKIYALLFGLKLSKRQRLTNWEADQLNPKQLAYASLDAIACVEIYEALMTRGHEIIKQGM